MVSAGGGGVVRVWDVAKKRKITEWKDGAALINGLALGRIGDCDVVISASADGMVRIRDAMTGVIISVLDGNDDEVNDVAVGLIEGRDTVVSVGDDGAIRRWQTDSAGDLALSMAIVDETGSVVEFATAEDGSRRLKHASPEAWRDWRAVAQTPEGRLSYPLDFMPRV